MKARETAEEVAALRSRDPAAFERMVRLHGPGMLAVARRITRSDSDAADCVQEAMLKAYQSLDRFEGRSSVRTWLHRITVNAALMKLRRKKRRSESEIDELLPVFDARDCRVEPVWSDTPSVEELLSRAQTQTMVREAIDQLPDGHRLVLLLRDIEGLSTSEAAALMEVSPGALKVRLHRARAALKKLLEPVLHPGGST